MVLYEVPNANVPRRAFSSITPFTYPDGITHLKLLETLRYYVTVTLPKSIEDTLGEFDDDINDRLADLIASVTLKINELTEYVDSRVEYVDAEIARLISLMEDAIDQIINSTIEITGPVINSVIQDTVGVINVANYEGTIVQRIRAAIEDANVGDVIRVTGSHTIDERIDVPPEKKLTLDFTGAVIESTVDSSEPAMLYGEGSFTESRPVVSIDEVSAATGDQTITTHALQLTGAVDWSAGDIVRIVSDDTIPGGHYTSDTRRPRMGDYAVVLYANGESLVLSGKIFESQEYKTNVRVAKLENPGTWEIRGGTFRHPASWRGTSTTGNFFRAVAMINPRETGVTVDFSMGMVFSHKACLGYLVSDYDVFYAEDAASRSVLGYVVHDSSCTGGRVVNGKARSARHLFTDGTNTSPALGDGVSLEADNVIDHGRTLFAHIDGFTAYYCTSPAIDTHHMSYGVEVANGSIYAGTNTHGIQFRGYAHKASNVSVYGAVYGLHIFTQGTTSGGTVWSPGDTSGIVVNGLKVYDSASVIVVNLYSHATNPNYGKMDSGKTLYATGVYGENIRQRLITCTNADVTLANVRLSLPADASGSKLAPARSRLIVRGMEYDASRVETISSTVYFMNVDTASAQSSTVSIRDVYVRASAAYRSGAPVFVNATRSSRYVEVLDIVFEDDWENDPEFVFASSLARLYNWRYQPRAGSASSRRTSSGLILTASEAGNTENLRKLVTVNSPNLSLVVNNTGTSNVDLATIPGGTQDAQQLSIMLGSAAGTLTVKHGSSFNTDLIGNEDRVLSGGGSGITLTWIGGLWREL